MFLKRIVLFKSSQLMDNPKHLLCCLCMGIFIWGIQDGLGTVTCFISQSHELVLGPYTTFVLRLSEYVWANAKCLLGELFPILLLVYVPSPEFLADGHS